MCVCVPYRNQATRIKPSTAKGASLKPNVSSGKSQSELKWGTTKSIISKCVLALVLNNFGPYTYTNPYPKCI